MIEQPLPVVMGLRASPMWGRQVFTFVNTGQRWIPGRNMYTVPDIFHLSLKVYSTWLYSPCCLAWLIKGLHLWPLCSLTPSCLASEDPGKRLRSGCLFSPYKGVSICVCLLTLTVFLKVDTVYGSFPSHSSNYSMYSSFWALGPWQLCCISSPTVSLVLLHCPLWPSTHIINPF